MQKLCKIMHIPQAIATFVHNVQQSRINYASIFQIMHYATTFNFQQLAPKINQKSRTTSYVCVNCTTCINMHPIFADDVLVTGARLSLVVKIHEYVSGSNPVIEFSNPVIELMHLGVLLFKF